MNYDLSHLTQQPDQAVLGPIQDDEALLLFALIRTMGLRRVLELGGAQGYSAHNFCSAVGSEGRVFTVDVNPVPKLFDNHVVLQKSAGDVCAADVQGLELDLVFFDCHVLDAQTSCYETLREQGVLTDDTVIAVHDTGLHPSKTVDSAVEFYRGGWAHQPSERRMVAYLMRKGWSAFNAHMDPSQNGPHLPFRHGLTLLQLRRTINP